MSSEITVSKTQAAWELLTTAARLYFNEESLVSVHSLAASGFQVLDDLSKGTQYEECNLIHRTISPYPPEVQKKFLREFRKPQNFIKHADRDKGESLTLSTGHTEVLLLCGTFLAGTVARECWAESLKETPPILFAYQLWFYKEYPETIDPDFAPHDWDILLKELPKHFPLVPCLSPDCSRLEFYEWVVTIWERVMHEVERWIEVTDFDSLIEDLMSNPEYAEFISQAAWLFENERKAEGSQG